MRMSRWLRSAIITATVIFFGIRVSQVFSAIEFSITNPITVQDEIEIDIFLGGLTNTSCQDNQCYLQGMLTAPSPTRYFGYTQNHLGAWFEYTSSPETTYLKSTFFAFEPQEGTWSGKLKIKNNPADPDYHGPDDYYLKVKRYSGKSSSDAGESNLLTIHLDNPLEPTPSPTPITPTPSPTTVTPSTKSPTPLPTSPKPASPKPSPTNTPTSTKTGQIAGISTQATNSSQTAIINLGPNNFAATPSAIPVHSPPSLKKPTKTSILPFFLIPIGTLLTGIGILLYSRYNRSL